MRLRIIENSQGFYLEEFHIFRWRRCELTVRSSRRDRFYSHKALYPAPYVTTVEDATQWAHDYRKNYGKLVVYRA
jgi:hypothetical protein